MFPGVRFNVAVEMIEQLRSLSGKKGEQSEGPLLQRVVWKQRTGNLVLMRVQDAGAKTFGAAGFCAQAIKLIKYFLGRRVERAHQRLIQLGKRFPQAVNDGLDRFLAVIESC